jgi:hypothetical protein
MKFLGFIESYMPFFVGSSRFKLCINCRILNAIMYYVALSLFRLLRIVVYSTLA